MSINEIAERILNAVGGSENISSVTYCMTRLRLVLKDTSKVQHDEIKKIPEVIQVVEFGGQFQVVLGAIVKDVYETIVRIGDLSGKAASRDAAAEEDEEPDAETDRDKQAEDRNRPGKEIQSALDALIGTLSGIFTPLIPAMLGMGFLKCLNVILNVFWGVTETNTTYAILNTLSDSFFYFLPLLVGWSAARRFNANAGIALMIIGLLIHPHFIELLETKNVSFLKIPVTNVSYASSVLPAILAVYLLSKVEIILRKVIPQTLRTIMVPFLSLLVVAPITILFLGPIGHWGGTAITSVFTSLYEFNPILAGALIGGTWQLLIIGGMHIVILSMVTVPNIAAFGRDTVIVTHAPSLICQCAAGLAVALKAKDPAIRKTAGSLTFSSFFAGSVIEPVMYGVNLKYKKPFYFTLVGGAIGGAIAGGSFAGVTAPVALSIYSLPAYFGQGFVGLMIGTLVGSLVTFLLTYISGIDETIE